MSRSHALASPLMSIVLPIFPRRPPPAKGIAAGIAEQGLQPGREMNTRRPAPMRQVGSAVVAGALAGAGAAAAIRIAPRGRGDRFTGKTVVITGGARGLGLALGRAFAREGARLVLVSRTAGELERAQRELGRLGAPAEIVLCDVRDGAAVRAAVEAIVAITGAIDVLVNNAGVIQMTPFEHAPDADFEEALRVHFWGALHFIRAVLPGMRQRHDGRIVNISSIGGRVAVPHLLPYSVSKFALAGLSDGLNAELAKDGIAVTTVTPWLMRTGSHRNVMVRGRHRAEAAWFGAGVATPLTSMRAARAARQNVDATRRRRARVSPGWESRTLQVASALAPELVARLLAMVSGTLLPGPDGMSGDSPRLSRSLDLGWMATLLPTRAALAYNQPIAPDEAR
jgi:NAD(P)-dependent dehydrogenase (short-subunit alcohol dehydrogenase family)